MKMISQYFSEKEMQCPCCGLLFVDQELLSSLDALRSMMGEAIRINSACRCDKHNKEVGGAPDSYHLTGPHNPCQAVDIPVPSADYRYRLVENAIGLDFGGIGVYSTFVHLDIRKAKTMWRG